MPSQILPLLRNEASKAVRRKLPAFGILVVGLLAVVVYFVAGRLSSAANANAWGYVAFSMQLLTTDLVPIFVIVFSTMLISEETGTGTIRSALAAPVHRWELFLAKAIIGLLYMLVISTAALLFSVALAAIHYKFGDVSDTYGIIFSRGQALREFALGCVLGWVPLAALTMFGLLISTIIRNPGAAVAAGISILFITEFTKHLVGFEPYVFTKYIGYSWVTLQDLAQGIAYKWQPEVWRMFKLSGACAAAAFGTGLTIFVRQDLNH